MYFNYCLYDIFGYILKSKILTSCENTGNTAEEQQKIETATMQRESIWTHLELELNCDIIIN